MNIDSALVEAVEATLAKADGQSDEFAKRFRRFVELVLNANFQEADVRRLMESISVDVDTD
jgi:hypothetical protein